MTKHKFIESKHQIALIGWCKVAKMPKHPRVIPNATVYDYIHSIPNGGKLAKKSAMIAVAEGLHKGVSDLKFSFPAGGYGGLYIEMKRPHVKGKTKAKMSPEQERWFKYQELAGIKCVCCFSWEDAKNEILSYLKLLK